MRLTASLILRLILARKMGRSATRVERIDLHRHVGAALLAAEGAPGTAAVRTVRGTARLACFWELEEAEVLADPARRERVPPIKGQASARI